MKKAILFFSAITIFLTSSCKKEDQDSSNESQDKPLYSVNDLNKDIIEKNCTILATGFNEVLTDPSLSYVNADKDFFCRAFTHAAIFFDDNSGSVGLEGINGITISDPMNKSREGKSNADDKDADNNLIVPKWLDIINYAGSGYYQYNKLDVQGGSVKKKYTSYVKSIGAVNGYFQSGFFHSDNPKLYSINELNEQLVKNSVTTVSAGLGALYKDFSLDSLQGVNVMRKFLDKIRFFDNKSGYFYVLNLDGYNLVQPPDHSVQGVNRYDLKDSRGTYLVRGLIETAKNGGGFYTYYYMNPATNKEEMKKAYVKLIPGTNYFLGAGVYLN